MGECMDVIKNLLHKLSLLDRHRHANHSLASLIENNHIPAGGMADCIQIVTKAIKETLEKGFHHTIEKREYYDFLALIYSSFYVFMPQGRPAALAALTYKQLDELMKEGSCQSDIFKTSYRYQLQPVLLSKELRELLILYKNFFRPLVAAKGPYNAGPDDILFLNYKGLPDRQKVSSRIVWFFEKYGYYQLNTNELRALMETEADKAYCRGEIGLEDKLAIQKINGHTGGTSRDYYVRQDRARDVSRAKQGYKKIFGQAPLQEEQTASVMSSGSQPAACSPLQRTSSCITDDPVHEKNWGSARDDYLQVEPTQRHVRWTAEELGCIRHLMQKLEDEGFSSPHPVSTLMKYIQNWPPAYPIFHPRHVLKLDSFRHGYETVLRHYMGHGKRGANKLPSFNK